MKKKQTATTPLLDDPIQDQKTYIQSLEDQKFDYRLVVAEAFVRGMRDIGYKSTASALNELNDNSIEAGAQNISIAFGYPEGSTNKPSKLAIIDDGHGMTPEMLRAAIIWGGGTHGKKQTMFGKYGFGLPSACVSIGMRFEVYSCVEGGDWHTVSLDLDEIGSGKMNDSDGIPRSRSAIKGEIPEWVREKIKGLTETKDKKQELVFKTGSLNHGTVVVIDKIDRLKWVTAANLEKNLLEDFGTTYRKVLRKTKIFVNGTKTVPVDPLFLDESARYHEENKLRAVGFPATSFDVKNQDSGEILGKVTVRYSYLPPGFQAISGVHAKGKNNARLPVMSHNNGILVLRAGRQIDVVTKNPDWHVFQNYSRNFKVEIEFPPSLDKEFSINTSKQGVVISDRMWELLKEHGVKRMITTLNKRYRAEVRKANELADKPELNKQRVSEVAMEESSKFKTRKSNPSPEEKKKRDERVRNEIADRVEATGRSEKEAKEIVLNELQSQKYKVEFIEIPEGAFYRVEAVGPQIRLFVNRAHRFYSDLYFGSESTPRVRSALECLLFVMGECELDSSDDRQQFYKSERLAWSHGLDNALSVLDRMDPSVDDETERDASSELEEDD